MKKMFVLLSLVSMLTISAVTAIAGENFHFDVTSQPYHFNGHVEDVTVQINDDNSIDLTYLIVGKDGMGNYDERHFENVNKTVDDNGVITYNYHNSEVINDGDHSMVGARESFYLVDSRKSDESDSEKFLVTGGYRSGYGWCGTMDFAFEFSAFPLN